MSTASPPAPFWRDASLVVLFGLVLLLPGSFSLPLIDRDEPKFSQATWEMMERGSWTVPTFNGDYRFDKPPLTYWWMSAHMILLGKTELAARLHAILSSVLVALALYEFGRALFSRWAGLCAAGGWLTCLQVALHGRLAVADMPMVLAVVVVARCLYALLLVPGLAKPWRWQLLLYVALALGFLAKGPIAWLVPLLGLVLMRLLLWKSKPVIFWNRLGWWWGLPLSLGLIAIWGVPALLETQGKFAESGLGEHVIERGVRSFNDRLFIPIYYPLTAFLSLYPWSPLVFAGFALMRRNWDAKQAFLLGWFIAPFIIFFFYATQLPHYVMPGFPAFFLLLFQTGQAPPFVKRWHRIGFWAVHGVVLSVAAALLSLLPFFATVEQGVLGRAVASLVFAMGLLGVMSVLVVFRQWKPALVASALYAMVWISVGFHLRAIHPVPKLAERVAALPPQTEMVGMGYS
ncbi:MAG: glycosyltransferase family 39 protein, partial [Verrucomicrobiota bacterium]